MPTAPYPARNMGQQELFNRCFKLVDGVNPNELGELRVAISGISIPPLAVELDCQNDSVQICGLNGAAIEPIKIDSNGNLLVSQGAVPRSEETATTTGSDLLFNTATEVVNYEVVFIGVVRTGGVENFQVDVSVKRGTILHPIYKNVNFNTFVSITDTIKLTANETIEITTVGVTTSTIDVTIIKEGV